MVDYGLIMVKWEGLMMMNKSAWWRMMVYAYDGFWRLWIIWAMMLVDACLQTNETLNYWVFRHPNKSAACKYMLHNWLAISKYISINLTNYIVDNLLTTINIRACKHLAIVMGMAHDD